MNKYSQVAIDATNLLQTTKLTPVEAWEQSALQVFPNSESSRQKGCPKSIFLGLCEEGLIKGSIVGSYTRSKLNKDYALQAVRLLQDNPSLADTPNALWDLIVQNKSSNSQMNVVTALWNHNLISKSK